jgi:hypothetical protein
MAAVETESGPSYEFRETGPSHDLRKTEYWQPSQGGGSILQDPRVGMTLPGDWHSSQGGGRERR